MVLATRCPHCETVFRVQDAQLARSHGRVRCGHCQEVFDASQNLLGPAAGSETTEHAPAEAMPERQSQEPPAETPAAAQAAPAHAAEPEAGFEAAAVAPEIPSAEPPAETTIEVPTAPHAAHETHETPDRGHRVNSVPHELPLGEHREPTLSPLSESFAEPLHEPLPDEAAPDEPHREPPHRAGTASPKPLPDDEPQFAPHEPAVPRWEADPEPRFRIPPHAEPGPPHTASAAEGLGIPPATPAGGGPHFPVTRERRANAPRHLLRGVLGTLLSLALAVLLVAQLAWWQRETVMVYWPGSQPLFVRVCAQFGCLISPPRDIDGLQVEASDLRQIDGPHKLELRVPLRNRYSVALAYPAIELTLFDAKNEVAIRRVLWPQDYLPPGTTLANGLPPRTSQTMIVRLDSGNAVATNFRVQIFYP
ncbi:DUF3426 domain-containing protein [Paraburkholderia sp. NMBU_R16]|uniref:DUF3426 domain-containing protein n=1 Tax=Paraburkholderia sp. NMBU_R16 TaxID=2698676 RepID=UPI00156548C4|nr:DUF3426 domain-containing protein [Paraburkholderia sp. NMBU_R16]NRO97159.1 DUF3426 domain-containing protein [Paraburkholderia sp. NMBU_R16]